MWMYTCIAMLCGMLCPISGDVTFSAGQPQVMTPIGTISGLEETRTINGQSKTVNTFLGIPYAENPSGANRFNKPIARAMFSGVYNATTPPPACFQGPAYIEVPGEQSENCLMLSVYVPLSYRPTQPGQTLPVMVWVHGGGFITGSANEYNFETLSLTGDVIIVALNYRLNVFGFLQSRDGRLTGNQGMWDQHLAFQWVNKNIAAFHGDPNQVTIFGHSAGAASVTLQAMYPGNKGLFRRVIAQSGSALSYWATYPHPNADYVFHGTGCDPGNVDPIICLRTMPVEQLHNITLQRKFNDNSQFQPYIDGDFLVESPYDIVYGNNSRSAAAREFFASLDILTGVTNYDGAANFLVWPSALNQTDYNNLTVSKSQFVNIIVPGMVQAKYHNCKFVNNATCKAIMRAVSFVYTDWSDLNDNQRRLELMSQLSSDSIFFVDANLLVKGHAALNQSSTYLYEFSAEPSRHIIHMPSIFHGSNHGDEIPFLGQPLANSTTYTHDQQRLADAMMTMWTNFAKSGEPNQPRDVTAYLGGTTWPTYDAAHQYYLDMDYNMTGGSVKQRFNARYQAFWTYLVPEIIKALSPSPATTPPPFNPGEILVG